MFLAISAYIVRKGNQEDVGARVSRLFAERKGWLAVSGHALQFDSVKLPQPCQNSSVAWLFQSSEFSPAGQWDFLAQKRS